MLRLITFNGLSFERDGSADAPALSPRRLALLAVVGAAGRVGITRDALLAIFWPESDQERARNALSQALFVIRRQLPDGALVDGRLDVRLDTDLLACDAAQFEAAIGAGDLETAAALYRGAFLHGVHIRDAEEFDRWRDTTAARLAQRYGDVLEQLAARAQAAGDPLAALRWWQQRAANEPLSSRIALRLMEAYVAAGDPVAAGEHARTHDALVREQFGSGDPAILALAAHIRAADYEPPTSLSATPPPTAAAALTRPNDKPVARQRPRVALLVGTLAVVLAATGAEYARSLRPSPVETLAVLPLSVIGAPTPASVSDIVRDGFTEELINALAQLPSLHVVARTSAFRFRDSIADPTEVAARLDVDAVVTGSIRRVGREFRVAMRIVRSGDGEAMWAGTFQRDTSHLILLEQDIAAAVAGALRPDSDTPAIASAGETRNGTAYSLYLEGLYRLNRRDPADMRRSIDLFTQALQVDTSFALAHAMIAQAHILLAPGSRSALDAARLASDAARRALALDERVSAAHSALAAAHQTNREWGAAEREFRRAIELNPSDALSRSWFGFLLFYTGQPERGLAQIEAARRLDPLHLGIAANLGWGYYFSRQYERAIEVFGQSLKVEANQPPIHNGIGRALQQLGRGDEAIAAYRQAVALAGRPQGTATLVHGLARFGHVAEARTIAGELRARRDADSYSLAIASVGLGEVDQAFKELTDAVEERAPLSIQVSVDPLFDAVRNDPRYADVVRRLGLEPRGYQAVSSLQLTRP